MGNLSLVLIKTSTFESYLSLSECWCLFCFCTRYLWEFYLFCMEKLMLFNPINWYVTSTSQWFFNRQEIVELCKVNFWLFIECNKDSSCEPKTGGFNIYLYGYVILLVFSVCPVCLCLFGWYQRKVLAKNTSYVRPKLTPCCIKHHKVLVVLGTRLSICRSIISLSKITHQMWGVILLDARMGVGWRHWTKKGG